VLFQSLIFAFLFSISSAVRAFSVLTVYAHLTLLLPVASVPSNLESKSAFFPIFFFHSVLHPLFFPSLRSRTHLKSAWGAGGALWALPTGCETVPQRKSNIVHFSLKIWYLVASFSCKLIDQKSSKNWLMGAGGAIGHGLVGLCGNPALLKTQGWKMREKQIACVVNVVNSRCHVKLYH